MQNFFKLVNHFIETGQLGDYDPDKYSITLYNIGNTPRNFNAIQGEIDKITRRYRWVTVSPNEPTTNIKLLDIDL